jgi:hypothetical protein
LAVGVLLVVGAALGGVLLYLQADRKEPVAAFASPVAAGEVIERADLRVVYVSHDEGVLTMTPTAAATVVGRRAVRDVARGALVTPDVVSDGSSLAAGEGVVGVAVAASAVPSSTLSAGDVVNVVVAGEAGEAGAVVVEGAVVHAVEDLDTGGLVVSLRTSIANADRIAGSDASKLRLVLVGR